MRFALIGNERIEARPGLQGLCPVCSQRVIAKCGQLKVWHWAHHSAKSCDSWSEGETEWHRHWKNKYPLDWQEKVLFDEQTGEKHIADVKTIHNLVIEFQHSAIQQGERISREKFYKNMIWVIDGTRLKRDYPRFRKGIENCRSTGQKGVYIVDYPEDVFPKNWLNSSVPVIFDFCGLSTIVQDRIQNTLWCLISYKRIRGAFIIGLARDHFIQITHNAGQLFEQKENSASKQNIEQHRNQVKRRQRPQTHFFDPKKGRYVKRRRL